MLNSRHPLILATALATGLVVAAPLASGQVRAPESATVQTNPGFKPDTGQINPGVEHQAPSTSTDIRKIPTPEESRAALLAPDDPNPVLGPEPPQPQNSTQADHKAVSPQAAGGDPTKATQGQAAIGGTLSPGASASGAASGDGNSANATAGARDQQGSAARETTGKNPEAAKPDRPGPIGATGQTMPAKFSSRNDILDRTPIMAWPQKLSDPERQRIYQAVMADKSQPAADADTLAPAGELSTEQALNGMHPLPASLGDIDAVKRLQYVKSKDKVLLVEPSTRIVVEQIKS